MRACSSDSTSRRRLGALLIGLAAAVVIGCGASAIPRPTAADSRWAAARWPGVTQADLDGGRDLYVRKCGGCHTLYEPRHVVSGDWPGRFVEMARRAKLSPPDRERIHRYLAAVARRE